MFHIIMPPFIRRMPAALILLLPIQLLQAETVNLPLKVDFPLLQQLVETQLFNGESVSTELLNDPDGCSEIVLSEPKLSEFNQHLKIDSRLSARLGIKLLDQCVSLAPWDGYIHIISDPVVKKDNPRQIYLQILESHLTSLDNEALTSGALWDQARKYIHPFFDQFQLDLAPSIEELKSFLPVFLSKHSHKQLDGMLSSLHLANMQVTAEGIQSNIALNIETVAQPARPEQALSEQEQQQWQQRWQSMDALLTYTIKHYAAETNLKELRLTLFDILLDARFQLQEALQNDQTNDPVRRWFLNSWSHLIPVMKQISVESPKHAPLALMTLVTATDALQVLDKLGPSFGLDISIDGLRRLARMLNHNPTIDPLKYNQELDPELLRLFQLSQNNDVHSHSSLNLWPISTAVAATNRPLNRWIPSPDELVNYLPEVRKLLLNSANQTLAKSSLTTQQKDIFRNIVMTTAWQESCWRQYRVKQNKIVPLSSTTGDTGIMQINEKIWRGFVDRHKLRWDIAYNAKTGSTILLNYMTRYAIKNAEHKFRGGMDNLARATYSAYNGGPGQFSRYRKNNIAKAHREIDKSFHDKYLKVKTGNELAVGEECLGQSIENNQFIPPKKDPVTLAKKTIIPAKKHQTNRKILIHNKSWINKQKLSYFTLQLGVFSSQQAANDFIQQRGITGNYAVYQQKKHRTLHYGVIYGYYSTRAKAENERLRFKPIKPWIRPFKDIQTATHF